MMEQNALFHELEAHAKIIADYQRRYPRLTMKAFPDEPEAVPDSSTPVDPVVSAIPDPVFMGNAPFQPQFVQG